MPAVRAFRGAIFNKPVVRSGPSSAGYRFMVNMMRDTDAETIEMLYRKVRFLETVLDELPTPVFAKSADARFCFFNKAYEEFYHVDRHGLLGRTVLELDHLSRESRERCQREDMAAIRMAESQEALRAVRSSRRSWEAARAGAPASRPAAKTCYASTKRSCAPAAASSATA